MYNTDYCNKYELTKKIGFLMYCHLSLLFIHVENRVYWYYINTFVDKNIELYHIIKPNIILKKMSIC